MDLFLLRAARPLIAVVGAPGPYMFCPATARGMQFYLRRLPVGEPTCVVGRLVSEPDVDRINASGRIRRE